MVVLETAQACFRGSTCLNGAGPATCLPAEFTRRVVLTRSRAVPVRANGIVLNAQETGVSLSGHPDALRRAEERRQRRAHMTLEAPQKTVLPGSECNWYEVEKPSNMMLVTTPQALEAAYQSADCLVVVEFFVPDCPGCRKLFPKLKQIAINNPDVRFVQVNAEPANEAMHTYATQTLGVQVLPFFMLYKRGHMKVKFAATLKRVDMIRSEIAVNKDEVSSQ